MRTASDQPGGQRSEPVEASPSVDTISADAPAPKSHELIGVLHGEDKPIAFDTLEEEMARLLGRAPGKAS